MLRLIDASAGSFDLLVVVSHILLVITNRASPCTVRGDAWTSCRLVFESPVWSGFLMPKGFNRNRNRSAFFLEVKKPDRTAKNRGLWSFCGP